ncbi:Lethal(2)neighbour of Tid protein [Microthyrium microscopicum]|uniref:Dol-P-Man:Man(5)GlcNAc(2)-PP-Dol alpha-1,3-mannosyltransferase n=1 Tax=Microthyrium microscopicum TaxID=703497 RepID=A0A6A6UJM9_9PEZI|nr:Lethal(2)neighbour of Tid protein [Microthyrium microscopicum]
MEQINQVLSIAQDPKQSRWIGRTLLALDALLCAAIIWKIPYTEIDWTTYMQHIKLYVKGEQDYAYLTGSTGPLVYPGLHVYIYRALYAITGEGENILLGQIIFAGLYLTTLSVVMSCYRNAKAPPYIFPLLVMSKRLHSIFMLRMFNDCFTVLFMFSAIYFYQKKSWNLGSVCFTCGLGVKMNIILIIPGLAFIFLQGLGVDRSFTQGLIMLQSQGLFAYEFVKVNWQSYLSHAFQFNRQFLYRWTVNWRFIPETIFLSTPFSTALLGLHAAILLVFATTRWTAPSRRSLKATIRLFLTDPDSEPADRIGMRITPDYIMTTLLTANAIGMLCARSLHYQFYSWIAWATPYLLWRAGVGPVGVYGVWALQEWAWNVYPSTDASSMAVVGCLAVQVFGVWWGTRKDHPVPSGDASDAEKKKEI